ncbi:MAG TPA: hypothetical protein VHS32_05020 [Streptosporangiaceae bacterium]|nr:hypothetical protein [Streptosporangiaceae bacterium]
MRAVEGEAFAQGLGGIALIIPPHSPPQPLGRPAAELAQGPVGAGSMTHVLAPNGTAPPQTGATVLVH